MKKSLISALRTAAACAAFFVGTASIFAMPASYFNANSRLANGHWVKVEVDTTGVYAIDYDQLRQWGFDRPERVAVYGTGGVVPTEHEFVANYPDDLPAAPSVRIGNRLFFFAEGNVRAVATSDRAATITRNLYDDHSYYFLTQAEEPIAAMPKVEYDGNPDERTILTGSLTVSLAEPEEYLPGKGGAQYFSRPMAAGESRRFELPIEDFTNRRNGGARVGYLGFSYIYNQEETGNYPPSVVLSDECTVTAANYGGTSAHAASNIFSSNSGSLNFSGDDVSDKLSLTFRVPSDFNGDFMCVDRVFAVYTRQNRLGSHSWRLLNIASTNAGTPIAIAEAPANLQVWNVTDAVNPVQLVPAAQANDTVLVTLDRTYSSTSAGRILIFDAEGDFPAPKFSSEIANQNLHAITEVPQMLIVATRTMMESAQELAQIHASVRNFDALVVCQDDIFNEFSSGSRNPQAIHRFVKMLHDRDSQDRFRYILFYGASIVDNRFINRTPQDVLVCMQAESMVEVSSNSTNFSPDVYFGMVDDNFDFDEIAIQRGQISVGRLPVNTIAQAQGVNRKIERFLTQPTSPANAMRAFFISDLDQSATKDEHCVHNDTARANLRRAFPDMVFNNLDMIEYSGAQEANGLVKGLARNTFSDALKAGYNLIWYSGHANYTSFTSPEMWNTASEKTLFNTTYPWGFFSTCLMNAFETRQGTLMETMVLNPDGGLIGGVGSGRDVYLVYNEWLNLAMARQLAAAVPGMTMADVFRLARNSIIPETNPTIARNRSRNTLCYNYCGDPSLPLHISSAKVDISAPEGVGTSADGLPAVPVQTEVVFKAEVDGLDNFNGYGQLRLFAPRVERHRQPSTKSTRKSKEWLGFLEHTFVDESDVLAEYPVRVENGRISASVVFPHSLQDSARVYIYVRDPETGVLATGNRLVNLVAASGDTPQFAQPVIEQFYIDSPAMTTGDVLESARQFTAVVRPGSAGVKGLESGFKGFKCFVDGPQQLSSLSSSFNEEGLMVIGGTLPLMSDGSHSLKLYVRDYADNSVSATLDFIIDSVPLSAAISVSPDASAVNSEVEFDVPELPESTQVTSLIVRDALGNTVRTISNPALPYVWNLTDAAGNAIADGSYSVHAMLRRNSSYGSTPAVTFTVIAR